MSTRKLEVVWVGDTKSLDKSLNHVEGATAKTGGKLSKFGGAMKAGLAGGILAVGAAAVKSVGDASDLSEQINKASVVFRGSEKDILKWSKSTDTGLGISQRAALEAAGVFGNMLVPMGFARKEAAGMSKGLVGLSADLASFNNANPEEVMEALRAGLSGETEPLRKFGVFLNQARVEQYALNKGLWDGKGNIDAAAKAQATYGLILHDTKDAQGDFKRTSGGLANQQRILKAEVENVSASLGKVLVPVAAKALGGLTGLIDGFRNGTGAAGWLKTAVGDTSHAVSKFASQFSGEFGSIKSAVSDVADVAIPVVKFLFGFMLDVAKDKLEATVQTVKGAFNVVKGVVEVISGILTGDFGKAWQGVKDIFGGAVNAVVGIVKNITAPMREAASVVMGALVHGVASLGGNLYEAAKNRVAAVVSGVRSILDDVLQAGKSVVSHVAQGIAGAATNLYEAAKNRAGAVVSGARSILDDVLQAGKSVVSHVADGIAGAGANLYDAIRDRVKAVLSGARSIIDDAKRIGGDIVDSVASGIRGAAGAIHGAWRWVMDRLNDAIPNSVKVGPVHINLPDNPFAQGGLVGGYASGGAVLARVGELGPETVALPVGSRVTQASESRGGPGGIELTVNNYGERLNEEMVASRVAYLVATS